MTIRIIDEKDIAGTRLLILDKDHLFSDKRPIIIGGNQYLSIKVHGLKNAVAIKCKKETPSMIGEILAVQT